MATDSTPRPVPVEIRIVFDRMPPYAKGRYALTTGIPYLARLVDANTRLYTTRDDNGTDFNVATYGQGYTNGGYWHIEPTEPCLAG